MALTEKLTAVADAIRDMSGSSEKLTLAAMPEQIRNLQSLNFQIVGNPRPETAAENTIWIDTDEEITGWVFSAAQPEGQAGMVWIQTGTSGGVEFNGLKKNAIMLCPLGAKQYIGGAWAEKSVKICRGGAWADWVTWLYDRGSTFEDVTGSIVTKAIAYNSSTTGKKVPVVTKNADHIQIVQEGSTTVPVTGIACFEKKINLTGYRTLHFDGILNDTKGGNPNRSMLGIWSNFGTYVADGRVAHLAADNADCEKTLDISALADGEYYIGFQVFSPDIYDKSYVTLRRLWLE